MKHLFAFLEKVLKENMENIFYQKHEFEQDKIYSLYIYIYKSVIYIRIESYESSTDCYKQKV